MSDVKFYAVFSILPLTNFVDSIRIDKVFYY